MLYPSADAWRAATAKRVLFFGMSGLGKTHIANMLRDSGEWFHYSVDYRIGTRYMGEHIVDNFKAHAMQDPFLAELLRTDSIYIASNITFDNLAPLSTYLGKPGDPDKGGLSFAEYQRRQALHHGAEVAALIDTAHFMDRANRLYGYDHFVCDSGGSICEVVDPENPDDPVLKQLAATHLMVWIEGSSDHTAELVRRFDKAPKPMCYAPEFLETSWTTYLTENNLSEREVDPDSFIRWTYARALAHRQPRYAAMAKNWGISVPAAALAETRSAADLDQLIVQALGNG
ncbi:ATPase [Litoreibacter roseus]|uniref:ATPase n=1 Tax=Litoreibacter roseus TaxID=2601869 RepID=UPI0013578CA6|nr:ATPase [Litoreibacter roseus]